MLHLGVRVSGPGSRGRALIVLSEILKVTKRSRMETHARSIGLALGDVDKANTRDPTERRSLLLCMLAYSELFRGHSSFMNGGRLVNLKHVVDAMMECVTISLQLLVLDIKVGTVGAEETGGLCAGVMESLEAVVLDPALKNKMESLENLESRERGGPTKEGHKEDGDDGSSSAIASSSVGGSVTVDCKTMDLDSDGEGMEDFDVE